MIKSRCAAAGLDPRAFSAHGRRYGYLAEAARTGVSLPEAMQQSRHRSVLQAARYYNEGENARGRAARLREGRQRRRPPFSKRYIMRMYGSQTFFAVKAKQGYNILMFANCRKSIATLRTIAIVAIVLLQALAPMATRGSASASGQGSVCSAANSGSGAPSHHHDPGLCCIVACCSCVCDHIAKSTDLCHFQERQFAIVCWIKTETRTSKRLGCSHFSARGPPSFS